MKNKLALFEEKEIRMIWKDDEWYFSITDIIFVLTNSSNPRRYWSDLKIKLENEGYIQMEKNTKLIPLTQKEYYV